MGDKSSLLTQRLPATVRRGRRWPPKALRGKRVRLVLEWLLVAVLLYSPVELSRMILIYLNAWPTYPNMIRNFEIELTVIWVPVAIAVGFWLRHARRL